MRQNLLHHLFFAMLTITGLLIFCTTGSAEEQTRNIFEMNFADSSYMPIKYPEGEGRISIISGEANIQDKYLLCSGFRKESTARGIPGKFELLPGKDYELTYSISKDKNPISLSVYIKYTRKDNPEISEYIVFAIKSGKLADAQDQWCVFGDNEDSVCMFYSPVKRGEARKYTSTRGGKFKFSKEIFGTEALNCEIQLSVNGLGNMKIGKMTLKELNASSGNIAKSENSSDGLKKAEEEEARRLMLDTVKKSESIKKKQSDEKTEITLKEILPLPKKYEKTKESFPESAINVKIAGSNFTRNGKPVFLLGGEEMSPAMCKMFGLDFFEYSSFMSPVKAEKTTNGLQVSFGEYPFLDTIIAQYLRSGLLVYVDLLQGYKIWQNKKILEQRPDLFISKEAFFAWRPEAADGLGQRIRYNNWASVLKTTRKYPVFIYELFNEIAYMDYSPYNISCFREEMRKKYGIIEKANQAWKTSYLSFYEVEAPDDKENKLSPEGKLHPQLRNDWIIFTEKRFGEIMKESSDWLGQEVPQAFKVIQSYAGLPFDYQNNHSSPELKIKAEDAYCCEHGSTFYPQWSGAVNEKEILSSMYMELFLDYLCHVSPSKPIIDGESPISAGIKSASQGTNILDLTGKWKFKASEEENNAKFEGLDIAGNMQEDRGIKELWYSTDYNDAGWTEINVPGMWGTQGFANTYMGWYRKSFELSSSHPRVYLCGAECADRANIYLNGKLIHSTKVWNERFNLDITDKIANGKNTIAIQMFNRYFNQGFYWGGIRAQISLSKVPFTRIPVSKNQMQSALWQRALHGLSGICVSYFYMNETNDSSCAMMNPDMVAPEAIASLGESKERINSLGTLLLGQRNRNAEIAILYSLDSFRNYIPKVPGSLSSDKTKDLMRKYGALCFAHLDFRVIGDSAMNRISESGLKALVIADAELSSKEILDELERFVLNGGILIVDSHSLSKNAFDGAPLDASSLLGAERIISEKTQPEKFKLKVPGLQKDFQTVAPESRANLISHLNLKNAEALAHDATGKVLASLRKAGKGRVYTITPELEAASLSAIYSKLLSDNNLFPSLEITATYLECRKIKNNDAELWMIHNWGAEEEINIKSREKFARGLYSVRDAVENNIIKGPLENGLWSDGDLASGIKLKAPNQKPIALLIEKTAAKSTVKETAADPAQMMIAKFWTPLWNNNEKTPAARILWYGKTSRTPALMPSAAAVARACSLGIDILDENKISESFRVLRGTKRIQAKLSDYKAIIIFKTHNGAIDENQSKLLDSYVSNGGGLFMAGTHHYGIHSYNSTWQSKLAAQFGITIQDNAIQDEKNMRLGEPRYFNSTAISPHPISTGVSQFSSYGSANLRFKSEKFKSIIRKEASDETALAAAEWGKGRIVVSGDVDFMTLDGLDDADNSILLANIFTWITGTIPPNKQAIRDAASFTN